MFLQSARGYVIILCSWRQTRSIPRAPLNTTWKYSLILFIFIFFLFNMICHWHRRALHCQLWVRRALVQFKDVLLRTRRGLSLYKAYGDSTLLLLNGPSFVSMNALLALSRRHIHFHINGYFHQNNQGKELPGIYLICLFIYILLWTLLFFICGSL